MGFKEFLVGWNNHAVNCDSIETVSVLCELLISNDIQPEVSRWNDSKAEYQPLTISDLVSIVAMEAFYKNIPSHANLFQKIAKIVHDALTEADKKCRICT